MRLFLVALLIAISYAQTDEDSVSQTIGSEKFVPDEIPQPPQTAKEGVLPPLTQLAEKHGMKEHKAYTAKLNNKVVTLENKDVAAGNALVKSLETSVMDAKKKLELAKESRDTAKEKVGNDERNHVAAGIFMHAEIKEATAQRKKYKEQADTAEARAQVKVKQAQSDVAAKNDIISQKDDDISRLGKDLKGEQEKAQSACDARIGKQRRENDEKTKQLTQIKDDEIANAKGAAKKAEADTQAERENCQQEAEAAKGRCQQEVDGVKEQVTQLQASIKEKNEQIKNAGEACNAQVGEAKNQCTEEKKVQQQQSREACDVEVANEQAKVKTADETLIAEKKKLADIEKRLTKDKDEAIAKCEEQKDVIDRASRDTVQKNQKTERDTCDKQKGALRDANRGTVSHLHKQIFELRADYKKAMDTMQSTQAQELKGLREQLRSAERSRDDYKDKFSNKDLQLKQAKAQLQSLTDSTKNIGGSGKSLESDLEADVASAGPEDMAVSSGSLIIYVGLILSAIFLTSLNVKLRGDSVKHRSYNTVLTEA